MKNCPSCDAAAEPSARYCLECGHAFEAAAEAGDPWQGREIAGRYRLVRKLGEGGMGEVYVAEQLAMDRLVALKLLREGLADDPGTVERFRREARAASRLSHPNTIILHDFGLDHDGTFYLAMELLEGEALAETLRREGRIAPERAVALLVQVCGSLDEAHAQGVVHRDLKPENIFLTRRGGLPDFVKVLDFGIAKVRARAADESVETLTRAGMIFGTPQYMSPEQIRGDELDARSDVYALGVMLYQMISGHLPFQAGTPVEMLTKHLHATPQPIGDVDAAHRAAVARLEAVALRALSKEAEHRQASARAFQEDLMAAVPQFGTAQLAGLTGSLAVAPPVEALDAPTRSRGGAGLMVAAFVAVAGAAAGLWYFGGGPRDPGPGGGALPAVLADQADGESAGAQKADADAQDEVAAGGEAKADGAPAEAPAAAAPTAEEVAAEEVAAEEEARQLEAEEAPADPKAAEEMAKKLEAETKVAEAEKKAAEAEARIKEAEEAKRAADVARAEAAAAKAIADAAKAESAADKAAADVAKQSAAAAQAEVERLKAELERAAAEKAAAEGRAAELEAKAEEAKAKAEAVRNQKKAAEAAFGRVFVQSSERGARVYVDGKLRGTTPRRALRLKPGRHTVELRKDKRTKKQAVTVTANGVHRIRLDL